MFKKLIISSLLSYLAASSVFAAQPLTAEQRTANYFNTIKADPEQLYIFLQQLPKGGDLHNHLAGATYVEDLFNYAKKDNFCIDPKTFLLTEPQQCPAALQVANINANSDLYRHIIENWSMDNFIPGQQSGEEHFFPTFIKFAPIISKHTSEVLTEVVARAGAERLSYLELMLTPFELGLVSSDGDLVGGADKKIVWSNNFVFMRAQLLQNGLGNFVQQIAQKITTAEQQMRQQLKCGTVQADVGCRVKVRYQYTTLREMPPLQIFAQLVTAFEAAKADPRIVGVNIVQEEDGPLAIQNYNLTMQMLNYLHKEYPQVHISLHAGELTPDNVTPEVIQYHIWQAVEIGRAERIGHGVDIAYEDNAAQLLQEMAAKKIMVEINLTSNAKILGVQGKDHPFPLYLRSGVPVALSTDDQGVLRTNITREFQRAVLTYQLTYPTLKMLARNSITYAFLPGNSLWQDPLKAVPVAACADEQLGNEEPTTRCQQFLAKSEKAQLQWQLESQFKEFERKY